VKGLASLRDLGYGLRIAGERVKQHRNEQKSVNQASFHAYLYKTTSGAGQTVLLLQ
jgi:hypothetical protein